MAVIEASDNNFKDILAENKVVAVKYYADWCGNCKLFSPKFKRVSNEEEFQSIAFIDVDAEKSPEARKAAKVDNLPYLAIFKDGQLLDGSASSKEEYLRSLLALAQ
jgi:thioredoxin 1